MSCMVIRYRYCIVERIVIFINIYVNTLIGLLSSVYKNLKIKLMMNYEQIRTNTYLLII